MSSETVRLHYFQRQLLGAADFIAEQVYHRTLRRRHNLGPHGIGVITGLQLVELAREGEADFRDIVLMPGLAIDLFGREIVVLAPVRLDPSLFAALDGDGKQPVWIAFEELAQVGGQGARMVCEGVDLFSRVMETYKLFAGIQVSDLWDLAQADITVGGDPAAPPAPPPAPPGQPQIPPDGSMPYQEFEPPDAQRRWLVRLGSVRWDHGAGKFRPVASQADLAEGRIWAGLFGSYLRSESSRLQLAPRAPFADMDAQDFATVDGRLTVQGRLTAKKDVQIHGGQAHFLNTVGADDNVPLWLQRRSFSGGKELHVHLGDDPVAKTARLSVGAGLPADEPVLAVRADRKLDAWQGKLRFPGGKLQQAIDLTLGGDDSKDGDYGIGVQTNAAYTRTAHDVYWYRGGQHADAHGAAGPGGSMLLQLSEEGRLFFGTQVKQMLNLWSTSYGIGVQGSTLYFRTGADFCWFRGGVHDDTRGDPGGGTRMLLLNNEGRMFFGSETKQMLNLWSDSYGIGVQAATTYFRSGADFCWFRGGSHDDTRSSPGGGTLAMKLDAFDGLSVTGGIHASGNLFARGLVVPIVDVQSGIQVLNATPGAGNSTASGIVNLDVTTAIANYATANIMVALCDISNTSVATDARWTVEPFGAPIRLAGNQARFPIRWQVDDTDGMLRKFSYVAIFTG